MIQLAKAFSLVVVATCSNNERAQACKDIGADLALCRNTDNIVRAVFDFTGGHGVNAVIDCIGDGTTSISLQALAVEGRLIQLASSDSMGLVNLRAIIDKQVTPSFLL